MGVTKKANGDAVASISADAASDASSVASSLDRINLDDIMDHPQFKSPREDRAGLQLNSSNLNGGSHTRGNDDAAASSSKEHLFRTGSNTSYLHEHQNGHESVTEDPRQDWKTWYYSRQPKNFYRKLFMGVSILSAVVILALQIYIFALYFIRLDSNSDTTLKKKAIATYLALFICAEIYQCIITFAAIRSKSRNQVYLLLTFIACMIVYSGIQLVELKHSLSPSLAAPYRSAPEGAIIAIIILLIASFISQFYLFFIHLRKDFAYDVWKQIGATPEASRRYEHFEYYRALLFFDGFFFPAFTLQFVIMMPKVETVEFVLTIIVIPVSIALLVFANYSAANEILYGSLVCLVGYFLGLVYAFFKIVRIYTHNTDPHQYYPGRKSLTLFAVFSILLLFISLFLGITVTRNFNKGLKPVVSKSWTRRMNHLRGVSGHEEHELGLKAHRTDHVDDAPHLDQNTSLNYDSYVNKPQTVPAIIVD